MSSSSAQRFPSSARRDILLRAASPAAIASASAGGDSLEHTVNSTTHAISSVGTMDELIATVPSRFRSFLAPCLREMQDVHIKLCAAQRALDDLTACKDNGSWPKYLPALDNPFKSVQTSKESRSATAPLLNKANTWHSLVRTQALDQFIEIKEAEVRTLDKKCSPATVQEAILELLVADKRTLETQFGRHVLPPSAKGKEQETGPKIPKFMLDDYVLAEQLAPVWVAKSWDFTRIRSQKTSATLQKKKDLRAQAPDPMEVDSQNIDKIVAAAVQRQMAEMKISGKSTPGRGKVSSSSYVSNLVTKSSLGKRELSPEKETLSAPKRQKSAGRDTQIPPECPHHYAKATESCKRCWVRTRWEEEQENLVNSCKWNTTNPSSMPKQILDLPEEKAISLIQARIPISQIVRADLNVKLGPGVSYIPEKVDEILSLGHRFLFPSVFSVELPLESYMSLARRIKWQVHFYYNKNTPSLLDQFAQFRLPSNIESTAVPDITPLWVVTMLEKGRLEMLRQIEAIPSTAANAPVNPIHKRDLARLRDWRKANNLLVLQSDKNLGTTVVDSSWYSSKLDALVSNNADFVQIDSHNYLEMIKVASDEIANFDNPSLPYEIKEYILANCNRQSAEKNLPRFHGLPKVHKEPWALRPIVPCHSYPLTNASKVLSMLLKPLVRDSPWTLESTQDLARLLETVRLDQSRKYWLCTGDVTAMYPNIPRKRAHQILGVTAANEGYGDHECALISKLAQWSDNHLAFSHGNKIFYQKDGLAMGIPAAPDVANLYMSHFEDSFAGKFPLYKRYIDDVFVLVEAPTRKAALKQLEVVQADNLSLTWSVDKETINFLDLQITQEAGYISFTPYRKPLNSYERLPFTSFHPQHVKRAAFCGEVSRIARLCSTHNEYYKQVAYVRDIYLKRGYPSTLLHNWIKAESKNRWDTRYTDAPEASGGSALWLKSVYNNVWQHIDLHKVWSAMMQGRINKPIPLAHIDDVKLSLKRLRNLGEINNKYNADVLKGLRVEEDEELLHQAVEPIQPTLQTPVPQIVKWGKYSQTTLNFPKV